MEPEPLNLFRKARAGTGNNPLKTAPWIWSFLEGAGADFYKNKSQELEARSFFRGSRELERVKKVIGSPPMIDSYTICCTHISKTEKEYF